MKTAICLTLVTVASARLSGTIDIDDYKISSRTRFESWMKLFNKHDSSFSTWKANDDFIQKTNSKGLSYQVGHNEFSDMSWEEFAPKYTGLKDADKYLQRPKNVNHALSSKAVVDAAPASIDWTTKNAVTPVKNQGQVCCCYFYVSSKFMFPPSCTLYVYLTN